MKIIKQHEKTRKLFKKLGAAFSPKEFGKMMSVWVPAECDNRLIPPPELATDWKVVNDPVEVERNIIAQSHRHFKQAQGTPFTISPLSQVNCADHPVAKEILQSGLPEH